MTLSYRSALAPTALGLTTARPAAQDLNGQPVRVTQLFPDKSTTAADYGTKTITPGGSLGAQPR